MLRLILHVTSPEPDATFDYDFAYVELTIPRIQRWLKLIGGARDLAERHNDFYALQHWSNDARYCSDRSHGLDELFGDLWYEKYAEGEWNLEPESFCPPRYQEQRTECGTVKVTPRGLWWKALPKHADMKVSTAEVATGDLHEFLDRLRGKHLKTR